MTSTMRTRLPIARGFFFTAASSKKARQGTSSSPPSERASAWRSSFRRLPSPRQRERLRLWGATPTRDTVWVTYQDLDGERFGLSFGTPAAPVQRQGAQDSRARPRSALRVAEQSAAMIAVSAWVMFLSTVRDRAALSMSFLLPPLLFIVFAAIFSGTSGPDLKLKVGVADIAQYGG